jgi:nicotinamide-nucleotide amidase
VTLRVETIAIGDEILTGKISDSNSTFVADHLFQIGQRLQRQNVVPDEFPEMEAILKECSERCDLVVCFGGLGPTSDDKTAECVANMLGTTLVEHLPSKERMLRYYEQRSRTVTKQSLKQVLYPQLSEPLANDVGMAPGFHCRMGRCEFFFCPGVPSEMRPMVTKNFIPAVEQRATKDGLGGSVLSHSWWCLGIWESELQRLMDPIEAALPPGSWLGYRTKTPENRLTLYARDSGPDARSLFEEWKVKIRECVSKWSYSEENLELEDIIASGLKKRAWRLALAESCTGGLAAKRLTLVPGSSDRIWGSYVCYQVAAKDRMLGVKLQSSEEAVSLDCTRRLAEAARAKSGCDMAAAVTGYLGPTGGTDCDPIGTVYLAVSGPGNSEQRVTVSTRSREEAQWSASTYLLNLIRLALEQN